MNKLIAWAKPWGGHHIPLGLLIAFLLGPVANVLFWVGKELGEATGRAGGTRQAFTDFSAWEPWDFITPSIAGAIIGALV